MRLLNSLQLEKEIQLACLHNFRWTRAVCTSCVLFDRNYGGKGNNQQFGIFNEPFNNSKKSIETLSHHKYTQFHKNVP